MKFEVISKQTGTYYKNLILKKFRENGDYITLWEVKNVLCNDATDEDKLVGWRSDIREKMRVRETKSGWFLYLPETNSSLTWNEEKININPETYEKPELSSEVEQVTVDENGFTIKYSNPTEKFIEIYEESNKKADTYIEKEIEAINEVTRALVHMNFDIYTRIDKLVDITGANSGHFYRPCIVKAKKSGLKEERQDRKAYFHRWAELTTGVQQVVAIVEFDDGHVEQVRPDRIIFGVEKEMEE